MHVMDYVNKILNQYPTSILSNYEHSMFSILHHAFIVLGNGIEWADTEDPSTGGYLVIPRYEKNNKDEWVRAKDLPYGTETHKLDPRAFKEKVYYFHDANDDDMSSYRTIFESELTELKKIHKVCEKFSDDYYENEAKGIYTHYYYSCSTIKGKDIRKNPYPNFNKKFSCFWEIEPSIIKEDWRIFGLDHLRYWQQYFNDEKRVKSYYHYPNVSQLEKYVIEHYKNHPEKYPHWIQSVQYNYEIPEFDGTNFELFASIRWERELKKTKEFLTETIARLKNV